MSKPGSDTFRNMQGSILTAAHSAGGHGCGATKPIANRKDVHKFKLVEDFARVCSGLTSTPYCFPRID